MDCPGLPALSARALGGVLAADPRAGQLHVVGRLQQAALVAALPADDVVRLAALLAALLPARRPAGVRLDGRALALVPEQRLALAVALDAQRHRRERRRAQLRRRERITLLAADAGEEVLPQRVGVVAL